MDAEEKSRLPNKRLYKVQLLFLRAIPYILFTFSALNVILSFLDIEIELFSMLCGTSLIPWLFIVVSSYTFRFCKYHRLMIWYAGLNELFAWFDYYYKFPITDGLFFVLLFVMLGIFIILITYYKIRNK